MTQICTSSIFFTDSKTWFWIFTTCFHGNKNKLLCFLFSTKCSETFQNEIFFGKSKITYFRSHAVTALTKVNYPMHHSCFLMNALILCDPKTTGESLQIITIIIPLEYFNTGFEEFQQLLENLLFGLNLRKLPNKTVLCWIFTLADCVVLDFRDLRLEATLGDKRHGLSPLQNSPFSLATGEARGVF